MARTQCQDCATNLFTLHEHTTIVRFLPWSLAASTPLAASVNSSSLQRRAGTCPQPVISTPTDGQTFKNGVIAFSGTTSTQCPDIKLYTDQGQAWYTTADATGRWYVSTGQALGYRDGWLAAAQASDPTSDLQPAQSTTTVSFNVVGPCTPPVIT